MADSVTLWIAVYQHDHCCFDGQLSSSTKRFADCRECHPFHGHCSDGSGGANEAYEANRHEETTVPDYAFETLRIHAAYDPKDHGNAVSPPIYQSAAFDLENTARAKRLWTGAEVGGIYTRVGNPTVSILEERIAKLDGGSAAIGLASGMSAISYVILLLGEGGGNIVAASSLYGAAQESLLHFFPKFGITTQFVTDRHDPQAYEALIDDDTRAIYLESISNPNAEIYDIEAIAEAAHRHGVPVIVDNTVATPYLYQPFKHGADIIVYSATKGICGHGNAIAGLVVENGTFEYSRERFPHLHELSWKLRDIDDNPRSPIDADPHAPIITALRCFHLEFIGAKLSPFDAYQVLDGLSTLVERLDKQISSTARIAQHLSNHPHVAWVRYAGLAQSPFHSLAERDFSHGAGALLSFGFKGSDEQIDAFIQALDVFSYHVNIGDFRSLIANPTHTTHTELEQEVLESADIPSNILRLSIGLEHVDDLIADLDHAFQLAFNEPTKE